MLIPLKEDQTDGIILTIQFSKGAAKYKWLKDIKIKDILK